MKYKELKNDRDRFERMYKVQKEMRTHYEELFACGVGELKFANLQTHHLKSLLEEVQVICKDELTLAVIENGINRANLDKLIHIREVFPNPEGLNGNKKEN